MTMTNQRAAEVLGRRATELREYQEVGMPPCIELQALDLAIRALSAPGEAVAWQVVEIGLSGKAYRNLFTYQPDMRAFGKDAVLTPLYTQPAASDAVVSEATCRKLLFGFMLDCNAIGPHGAGENLAKSMKQAAALAPEQATPAADQPGGGFVRVPRDDAERLLTHIQRVTKAAYNRGRQVCCGYPQGTECCMCPDIEWDDEDEEIMAELGPFEDRLSALLAAAPQDGGA